MGVDYRLEHCATKFDAMRSGGACNNLQLIEAVDGISALSKPTHDRCRNYLADRRSVTWTDQQFPELLLPQPRPQPSADERRPGGLHLKSQPTGSTDQQYREDAVTSQGKKVIVKADAFELKHLGEDFAEDLLVRCSWSPVGIELRRGCGKSAAIDFPIGGRGQLSRTTKAEGVM